MHELSIAEALIEQVQETLAEAKCQGRVARIEVSIGRLSGVNCEAFRFAFELLTPGTILEDAEVLIRRPKARCRCRACKARCEINGIEDVPTACPRCGSEEITIEGGRELVLQGIDVEETA